MNCKDCIHNDVCEDYKRNICTECNWRHEEFCMDDGICRYFKYKSKYIELPCKVGDTVYVIKNNKICAKDIVYYNKIHSRVAEQNEEYWHCVDKDRISINVITFYPENIGQTVFLTKSEAEQKLKELKENA